MKRFKKNAKYKYVYTISSERANSHKNELHQKMYSDVIRHVGDVIYLNDLAWTIEEVQVNERN